VFAYTTVQTLVYRLEQKGALRKVNKLAMLSYSSLQSTRANFEGGLVRDLLDLFGGSPSPAGLQSSRNRHDHTKGFKGPSKRGAKRQRTAVDVEGKVMHEQITHAIYYFEGTPAL